VRHSHEAGFTAYLTKPVSSELLLETVAAVSTGKPAPTLAATTG
jgi:hypothetical protein